MKTYLVYYCQFDYDQNLKFNTLYINKFQFAYCLCISLDTLSIRKTAFFPACLLLRFINKRLNTFLFLFFKIPLKRCRHQNIDQVNK